MVFTTNIATGSNYRQYKQDTAIVASWLTATAEKHGYSARLSTPSLHHHTTKGQAKGGGRLKGKARKEAKDQAAAAQGSKDKHMGSAISKLDPGDFVPLARFIVALKPVVQVPLYFITAINRTIISRKRFWQMWGGNDEGLDEDTRESNKGHLHFICVLEEVRTILQPRMPAGAFKFTSVLQAMPESSPNTSSAARKPAAQNNFDTLKLHELPDQPEEFIHTVTDTTSSTESLSELEIKYGVADEDSFEDALFIFISIIQETFDLRQSINELWHQAAANNLDLAAVAVATNTAIELCKELEEGLTPLFDKHGGVKGLMNAWYMRLCLMMNIDPFLEECSEDVINPAAYDVADSIMYNSMNVLILFKKVYSPIIVQGYNGHFGWYDETMDTSTASNRVKLSQDCSALLEILPDLVLSSKIFKEKAVEDHFARGVNWMIETDNMPPLWLCFAGQVHLDILRQFHGHLDKSWGKMRAMNRMMEKSISSALESISELGPETEWWPDRNTEILKGLVHLARFWKSDPVAGYKNQHGVHAKPHNFLRRNPLFCGLWIHHMRTQFHITGVQVARCWGSVVHTFGLYYAMKKEGLLEPQVQWKDLDLVYKMQGRDGFFVGHLPTSINGYLKNCALMNGYSISNWVEHRRDPDRERLSRAGSRSFKHLGTVSMIFMGHFSEANKSKMTAEYVGQFIQKSDWVLIEGKDKKVFHRHMPARTRSNQNPGENNDISLPILVQKLALALHPEVPEISVNYFALHNSCWMTLGKIREVAHPYLQMKFGRHYINSEVHLSKVVHKLFTIAREEEEHQGFSSELFQEVAAILKQTASQGQIESIRYRLRD